MTAKARECTCVTSLAQFLARPKPHRSSLYRPAWSEDLNLDFGSSLQDVACEMTVAARESERKQKPAFHIFCVVVANRRPAANSDGFRGNRYPSRFFVTDHQAVYVAHAYEAY